MADRFMAFSISIPPRYELMATTRQSKRRYKRTLKRS
jgi:hypothetical protein